MLLPSYSCLMQVCANELHLLAALYYQHTWCILCSFTPCLLLMASSGLKIFEHLMRALQSFLDLTSLNLSLNPTHVGSFHVSNAMSPALWVIGCLVVVPIM